MRQSDAASVDGSRGKHFSEGCVMALAVLAERGDGAITALEERLTGVRTGRPLAPGVLSKILSGHRPVSIAMGQQLKTELGVEIEAWGRPVEQSISVRHNRRARRRPQEGAQVT